MNLCTDQYALMLAAPGQLVSVSHVSADPVSSPMAAATAGLHLNHGGAEQIYLLSPDLVLAHPWSDPTALAMLRRLGLRVVQVPGVDSLPDIPARLAEVGALLGREEAAQTLIRRFETDLAALTAADLGPRAVLYGPNGYTTGEGALAHEVLTRAGFRNVAAEIGRSDTGQIALELLVMAAPDLIVRAETFPGASRAEEILHHPALMALIAAGTGHEDSPDWACGTPRIIAALRDLVDARQAMEAAP
ncbi:ABC transporter substrate-binding protein [Roseicyclus persicicus]|uniref:ABC transporter substrate-binding protein n=1 Tax=Roseicyclus persicicus TaxID=2650661 RepID=A0A7X6JZG3_9RHOB|nr:ABC transporter substrate-binding protein [Roseibacterium persicicum]NKX45145.1 ABC transporter substrate-binding protein [Roseibacterium persicicum]